MSDDAETFRWPNPDEPEPQNSKHKIQNLQRSQIGLDFEF